MSFWSFLVLKNLLLFIRLVVTTKTEKDQQEEDVKPTPNSLLGDEAEQMLINALDGFLLALSEDGDITYVSENITDILGLHQVRTNELKSAIDEIRRNVLGVLEMGEFMTNFNDPSIIFFLPIKIDILSQPIWDYAHQVSCTKDSIKLRIITNCIYLS